MWILHTFVILLHGLFPCSSARKLVFSWETGIPPAVLSGVISAIKLIQACPCSVCMGCSVPSLHLGLCFGLLLLLFYSRACATIHFGFCSALSPKCACLACALLITEYRVQDPCCESGISFCFLGFGVFLLLFPHSSSCKFTDPGIRFLFPSKKNNNRSLSSSLPCSSSEISSF